MKKFLCLSMILFTPMFSQAQPIAKGRDEHTPVNVGKIVTPTKALTYTEGFAASLSTGQPLLTFVGQPAQSVKGYIVCEAASLDGYPAKCVVESYTENGGHYYRATYASTQEVGRAAIPFGQAFNVDGSKCASVEAIDMVNEQRRQRGLRPYLRDDGLTLAAMRVAQHRAERRITGHVNDFAFLPAGSNASAAGCAAWSDGFGACCMFEGWTYCGAAYCVGEDGLKYCHVYVR